MTYPVFLELKNVNTAIVGGGRIALRKIKKLMAAQAQIRVIAPHIIEEIKALCETYDKIEIIERAFYVEALEGATLVLLTSSCQETNALGSTYCRENGILFNDCMDSQSSTFRNGAVLRRGEVEVAVGSGGKRPGLSKWLCGRIEKAMPENLEEIIAYYDQLRKTARGSYDDSKHREKYIKETFSAYLEQLEGSNHED